MEKLIGHALSFDSIIKNRLKAASELLKESSTYLTETENQDVMFKVIGAEIEINGKTKKATALGKQRGFGTNKVRGNCLKDYYEKKSWTIISIHKAIQDLINSSKREIMLDSDLKEDYKNELNEIKLQAKRRGEEKKLEKFKRLMDKCEKKLIEGEKTNKELEKIFEKSVRTLKALYANNSQQMRKVKRLTGRGAKRTYKQIRSLNKEEVILRKELFKELYNTTDKHFKDTNEYVDFLNDLMKEIESIGKKDQRVKNLVEFLEKNLRFLKRTSKLIKKEKKKNKKIKRIKKLSESDEEKEARKLTESMEESERLIKDIENEEDEMEKIIKSMNLMDSFIKKMFTYGVRLTSSYTYNIQYVSQSLISAKKSIKRDPIKTKKFIINISQYAEKTINDIITKDGKEDEEFKKSIDKESEFVFSILKTIDKIINSNKEETTDKLDSIEKIVKKIRRELEKRFDQSEKHLENIAKAEEEAKNKDRKINKDNRKAGVNTQKEGIKDIKRQRENLELETREVDFMRERLKERYERVIQAINKSRNKLPDYKSIENSFLEKKRLKDIFNKVKEYLSEKGKLNKDLENINEIFKEWLKKPYEIEKYLKFINEMNKRTKDEEEMLRNISTLYRQISEKNNKLREFFDRLEETIISMSEINTSLGFLEKDFGQYLADNKLFEDTRKDYELLKEELVKTRNLERSIKIIVYSSESVTGSAEDFSRETRKLEAVTNDTNKRLSGVDWTQLEEEFSESAMEDLAPD